MVRLAERTDDASRGARRPRSAGATARKLTHRLALEAPPQQGGDVKTRHEQREDEQDDAWRRGVESEIVDRAHTIADSVLFPNAQVVDRSSIPSTHFDALRDAGLFSLVDASPATARRVMAAIAGGCGATFFVWVQHHGVVRNVGSSTNTALRDELLPGLLDGSVVAGTAFAHVRRPGSTAVRATRTNDGWQLDGRAPWATSWGIADRFAVAATTDDGQIVWAMLPGDGGPGITTLPLELPVFGATGTVAIEFDASPVNDDAVLAVESAERWREADRWRAAIGAPAVLGVAERAVRLMRSVARSDDEPARAAVARLGRELDRRWRADDELTASLGRRPSPTSEAPPDNTDLGKLITAASEHRTQCLDLGQRAATALLAAVGGGGMDLTHPAQRLAREAAFYVIQAQTADGRRATLDAV